MAAEQFANIVSTLNVIKSIVNNGMQNYKPKDLKFMDAEFSYITPTSLGYKSPPLTQNTGSGNVELIYYICGKTDDTICINIKYWLSESSSIEYNNCTEINFIKQGKLILKIEYIDEVYLITYIKGFNMKTFDYTHIERLKHFDLAQKMLNYFNEAISSNKPTGYVTKAAK
jgi:hypothetical protein